MEPEETYDEPWYGLGHVQFVTTNIDGWIAEDAPPERAQFLATITSRWRHFDWGTIDEDQAKRNEYLVEHDIPGVVVGQYEAPPSLEPEYPNLLVTTKFSKHGQNLLALYAAIEWQKPQDQRSAGQDRRTDGLSQIQCEPL